MLTLRSYDDVIGESRLRRNRLIGARLSCGAPGLNAKPEEVPVRREVGVRIDHSGRHVEDDVVAVDPLGDVGRFLGDRAEERVRSAAERAPALLAEPGQAQLVDRAVDGGASESEAEPERGPLEVREQVDLRIFGHPIGPLERLQEPPRVRSVALAARDAVAAMIAVPSPAHAWNIPAIVPGQAMH